MPRKKGKRGGSASSGAKFAVRGTRQFVSQLSSYHKQLSRQAADIQSELTMVSNVLQALGVLKSKAAASPIRKNSPATHTPAAPSAAGKRVPKRGPRPEGMMLRDFVLKVLSRAGKPMQVSDIADGVRKAGYATASNNLPNQVSMTLTTLAKSRKVKKLKRGQYSA